MYILLFSLVSKKCPPWAYLTILQLVRLTSFKGWSPSFKMAKTLKPLEKATAINIPKGCRATLSGSSLKY